MLPGECVDLDGLVVFQEGKGEGDQDTPKEEEHPEEAREVRLESKGVKED